MTDSGLLQCNGCGTDLPEGRVLEKCAPCHYAQVKQWRKSLTLQPTRQFPGVDIDRIHRTWRK